MILASIRGVRYMTVVGLRRRLVLSCIPNPTESYIENTKMSYHYTVRLLPYPWYYSQYR